MAYKYMKFSFFNYVLSTQLFSAAGKINAEVTMKDRHDELATRTDTMSCCPGTSSDASPLDGTRTFWAEMTLRMGGDLENQGWRWLSGSSLALNAMRL